MLFIIIILQLYMLLLREAGTEIHENHDFSIFKNFSSIFKFTIITYNNSPVSDFFMFFYHVYVNSGIPWSTELY